MNPVTGAGRLLKLATGSVGFVERVLADAPQLLVDASRLLVAASTLMHRVDELLTRVEATRSRADNVIAGCGQARARADGVIASIDRLVARGAGLFDELERPARAALPLARAVSTIDPEVINQLAGLADLADLVPVTRRLHPLLTAAGDLDPELVRLLGNLRPLLASLSLLDDEITNAFAGDYADVLRKLPTLLAQMTDEVVPSLETLATAVPDMKELRQVVTRLEPMLVDVELVMAGMPGAGRLRRRGERELEDSPIELNGGEH